MSFGAFIFNPLFCSRTSTVLRKFVVVFFGAYFFVGANNHFENKLALYSIGMYDYYPESVKRYLYTKDYRYLQTSKFRVEDYDLITKKPKI